MAVLPLPSDYFVIAVTLGALLITLLSICAYTIWCCKCCECPDGTEYPEMNVLPGRLRRASKTFETTLYMHIPVKSEQIV